MKKFLPVILIVVGLLLAVFGYTKFGDSGASLEVGGMEVSATDDGGRTQAYALMGLGAVSLLAGIGMMAKSKS